MDLASSVLKESHCLKDSSGKLSHFVSNLQNCETFLPLNFCHVQNYYLSSNAYNLVATFSSLED